VLAALFAKVVVLPVNVGEAVSANVDPLPDKPVIVVPLICVAFAFPSCPSSCQYVHQMSLKSSVRPTYHLLSGCRSCPTS